MTPQFQPVTRWHSRMLCISLQRTSFWESSYLDGPWVWPRGQSAAALHLMSCVWDCSALADDHLLNVTLAIYGGNDPRPSNHRQSRAPRSIQQLARSQQQWPRCHGSNGEWTDRYVVYLKSTLLVLKNIDPQFKVISIFSLLQVMRWVFEYQLCLRISSYITKTTANTLAFTFALLALYQDEQEKLYEHIKSVIPDGRIPVSYIFSSLSDRPGC